jgi:AraC-like DNA-binding protein
MSEEHSMQTTPAAYAPHASAQARDLVRRAMSFLEINRAAAWRCLNDASKLLGRDSDEPQIESRAAHDAARRGGLVKWRANRALAYIEANLGSKIALNDVAEVAALSKSHFSRAFKQSLGLAPMAYVSTRRVERAKAMMRSSQECLSNIALACGFADQSHLNRNFRRIVGSSPGAWRRNVEPPKARDAGGHATGPGCCV